MTSQDGGLDRRTVLAVAGGALAAGLSGCTGSPYSFEDGRSGVQQAIADRLTEDTRYDYVPDRNAEEDPPNEVFVGWRNGVLNVSIDAPEDLESRFCEETYWDKELQQNGTKMERAQGRALERLRAEEPALDAVVHHGFLGAMERAEAPDDGDFPLEFDVDLANGTIVYSDDDPMALYDRATAADDTRAVLLEAFWGEARFDCSAASGPRPPGAGE